MLSLCPSTAACLRQTFTKAALLQEAQLIRVEAKKKYAHGRFDQMLQTSDGLHARELDSTRFYTACRRPNQLHASNTCA